MVQTWANRMTEAGKAVGGHLQDMDWMHTFHFADGDMGALSPAQIDQIHSEHKNNSGDSALERPAGSLADGPARTAHAPL